MPSLSQADCQNDMQDSQQFMSMLEDLTRGSNSSLLFETDVPQTFSQTTSTRSTADAVFPSKAERKLEINRKSQKRVRERRKVHKP